MANKKFGATAEFKLKRDKKKKPLRGFQKFLIIFASVIGVLLLAGLLIFSYYKYIRKPTPSPVNRPNALNTYDDTQNDSYGKQSKYSFLMLGCDKRNWLSDVIMIATYDVAEKQIALIQIPRDTYVTVSNKLILKDNEKENYRVISNENFNSQNGAEMKINTVLSFAGTFAENELGNLVALAKKASDGDIAKLCSDTFLDIDGATLKQYMSAKGNEKANVEYEIKMNFAIKYLSSLLSSSFGIPLDFYAQVNVDGFDNIVDAIGGVDIYVQHDMDYADPMQNLHIHIKKGYQHMDGKTAEGFVRFRYGYATADIARTDAQKIFMTAFIKKAISLEGIMNLNNLITEIRSNLNTNVSFEDAMYFATNALDVDLSSITMFTCPGTSLYQNGVSYYTVNKTAVLEMINEYLNKYETPLTEDALSIIELSDSLPYGNDTFTASDIDDNQPHLGFVVPKPVSDEPKGDETPDEPDTGAGEENPDGNTDAQNPDGDVQNTDEPDNTDENAQSGENGGENAAETGTEGGNSPSVNPPSDDAPIIFKNEDEQ
jgi:LCP family protein required for cell wall assembly